MTRALIMVMLVGFGSQGCCCARSVETGSPDQVPAVRHYVGIVIALPAAESGERGLWFHAKATITARDWAQDLSAVGLPRTRDGVWTGPSPLERPWPDEKDLNEDLRVQFPLHARPGEDGEFIYATDGDARVIWKGREEVIALPGEDFVLRVRYTGDPETAVQLDVVYEHSKDNMVLHRGEARNLRVSMKSALFVVMEARGVARRSASRQSPLPSLIRDRSSALNP